MTGDVSDPRPRPAQVHGWLVDPQDVECSAAVADKSYNQLVEEIVNQQAAASDETTAAPTPSPPPPPPPPPPPRVDSEAEELAAALRMSMNDLKLDNDAEVHAGAATTAAAAEPEPAQPVDYMAQMMELAEPAPLAQSGGTEDEQAERAAAEAVDPPAPEAAPALPPLAESAEVQQPLPPTSDAADVAAAEVKTRTEAEAEAAAEREAEAEAEGLSDDKGKRPAVAEEEPSGAEGTEKVKAQGSTSESATEAAGSVRASGKVVFHQAARGTTQARKKCAVAVTTYTRRWTGVHQQEGSEAVARRLAKTTTMQRFLEETAAQVASHTNYGRPFGSILVGSSVSLSLPVRH